MPSEPQPTDARSNAERSNLSFAAGAIVFAVLFAIGVIAFPQADGSVGRFWGALTVLAVPATVVLVRYAARYVRRGCGCLLDPHRYAFETVETEHEWRRSRDGEKVRWEKHRTELRRCEKCGEHYHTEVDDPVETREMWPEEEPEEMPDSTDLEPALGM